MPPIEARVKDLLDETRLAMLGTQLLLGLQYRAAFTPGFKRLPELLQMLDCVALLSILVSAGLLLSTAAFHQISEAGHATNRFVHRASGMLQAALPPLALTLGIDVAIGLESSAGAWGAASAACVFIAMAILIWLVVPLRARKHLSHTEEEMEDKQQTLEARIVQALTELRVILPGAQALFGFQVSAVLTDRFRELSATSTAVHLVAIGVVVVAIILLIAPATYHRIAADGNAEEAVLRYTVRMMLPAEGLIAVALVGDAYVTVRMISGSPVFALVLAAAAAVGFALLLYGLPLAARLRRQRQRADAAHAAG